MCRRLCVRACAPPPPPRASIAPGLLTLLQRILNLVVLPCVMILTLRASLRRAVCRNSRISEISLGLTNRGRERRGEGEGGARVRLGRTMPVCGAKGRWWRAGRRP